jgi:hypothetical protein
VKRLVAALVLVAACRSVGPGDPIRPLTAATPADALEQLHARAEAFRGARSLLRVRVTRGGEESAQNFRAQLVVPDRTRMELIAYTPVGTTAVMIKAEGDKVTFKNHLRGMTVEGSAEEFARVMAVYAGELQPAEMALLILGLPPRRDIAYEATIAGLARAVVGDATVTFDPAQYPPARVTIRRGTDTVEIEHLETVAIR